MRKKLFPLTIAISLSLILAALLAYAQLEAITGRAIGTDTARFEVVGETPPDGGSPICTATDQASCNTDSRCCWDSACQELAAEAACLSRESSGLALEEVVEAEIPGNPVMRTIDPSKFFNNMPISITVKPREGSDVSAITRIETSSSDAGLQTGLSRDLTENKYAGISTVQRVFLANTYASFKTAIDALLN